MFTPNSWHPWDERYIYLHENHSFPITLQPLNVGKYTVRPMDGMGNTSLPSTHRLLNDGFLNKDPANLLYNYLSER